MYKTASELYNDFLGIYFNEYNELSDAKRNKMKDKNKPSNLFLETYNIMTGVKMKNRLTQQDKVINKKRLIKTLMIYPQCYH